MKSSSTQYKCQQGLLYSICLASWAACSNNIDFFAAFKAMYTPAYIQAATDAVNAAKQLPDTLKGMENRKSARINLVQSGVPVKNYWQNLKMYITAAFSAELVPAMLDGAGASYYAKADANNWTAMSDLINAANNFIDAHLDELMANDNMPGTFPKAFARAGEDFINQALLFYNADNQKKILVADKIEANNGINNTLMAMMKDGQQVFRNDPATKALFVFDAQLQLRQGTGVASLAGYITNESKLPISGAVITSDELGYRAITNAKGHYSINRMLAGTYFITISCPGYAPVEQQITLTAGTKAKGSATLGGAIKKVA